MAEDSTDGLDGRIRVKKQEIRSPTITSPDPETIGHYAYWIGDESLKANFAVRDPFSDTGVGTEEYRNRLQVPQRLGWERMDGFASANLDIDSPEFLKVIATSQIPMVDSSLDDSINNRGPIPRNFHNLTAYSKSLLTDTALGGLKKDLTVFFEQGDTPLDLDDPIFDADRYDRDDPRFGLQNNGFPKNAGALENLPTWRNLFDWADGQASSDVIRGRAPILANYKVFFGFTYESGRIQFHMVPYVALWNPYDVELQLTNYELKWRHSFTMNQFGVATLDQPDPTPLDPSDGMARGTALVHALTGLGWYSSKQGTTLSGAPLSGTAPRYRFAPFDDQNDTNPIRVPDPSSPNATWVTYRLQNQRFNPGQVKVFTVGTSRKIDDPRDLHTGAETIELVNEFDPDSPSSYYFDIASVSNPQPSDLAKMKIYGSLLVGANNTPGFMSMQLSKAGGPVLWRSEYLGQSGNWNVNLTFAFIPGLEMNISNPSTWRRLYDRSTWNTTSKNNTPRSLTYPLIAMYRGRAEPFTRTINDTYTSNNGINGMSNLALANFPRAFAVFNMFAPVSDLDLNLEGSRGLDTANNTDRFRTNALYRAEISTADGGGWGNVEHFEVKGPDTEGFALLTWLRRDVADITPVNPLLARKGISSLPMRQASRADANLLSLGQFQQANLSQLAWQPSFPFANSEASPYVDRARVAGIESYQVGTASNQNAVAVRTYFRPLGTLPNNQTNKYLDISYVLNESLWDSYFLSSIPDSGQLNPETILPNSRHRFIDESNIDESSARDFDLAASQLYNFGALNVNSTSVEAWKALLTAFRGLAFEGEAESRAADEIEESIPVSRVLDPTPTDLGGGNLKFTFTTDDDGLNPAVDYDAAAIGADTITSGGVNSVRDFSKFFNGYRHLTDDMIDALARRIVDEVRLRGPFYSLSDFVNRRLVAPDRAYTNNSVWQRARTSNASSGNVGLTHSYGVEPGFFSDGSLSAYTDIGNLASDYDSFIGLAGINGTLQRAINLSGINGGINYPEADNESSNQTDFAFHTTLSPRTLSRTGSGNLPLQIYPSNAHYLDSEHMAGAPTGEVGQLLSHTPGFVTQGDLLAMLGPALTPRGDTFLIRTYGDALNPATGELTGRAWLEAVVQRTVDPVTPAGENGEDKYRYTDSFGRRFRIISFRWLSENEL